ncbi:MAG: hypothetical protein QGG42_10510 [Phycisphaerae bacterium]|nr:hypothetical protein [Phycisphaerae bacterium]
MTWLPGVDLQEKGKKPLEADLAAFCGRIGRGHCGREPILVLGECKSYGPFKKRDVDRMATLAAIFPGSTIAFCTLRTELTSEEITRIALLAKKGREIWRGDMWHNPVLVLTGTELFDFDGPPICWKGKQFPVYLQKMLLVRDIYELCDITQQLHLNMVPHATWQAQEFEKQKNRRAKKREQNP